MQEIAKAVFLEDILFGKFNSQQRVEVRIINLKIKRFNLSKVRYKPRYKS